MFSCSLHPGMSGKVYVNATGTVPTPSATRDRRRPRPPRPPHRRTATRDARRRAPPARAPPHRRRGTPAAATLRTAIVSREACVRRGPRCRRPGVRLRIDLSAPADVRGTLRRRAPGARRFQAFGSVRFGRVAAGPRTLKFTRTAAGRRLRPGRYSLALRAGERAQDARVPRALACGACRS